MNLLKVLFSKRPLEDDNAAISKSLANAAQREKERLEYIEWVTLRDKERAKNPEPPYLGSDF